MDNQIQKILEKAVKGEQLNKESGQKKIYETFFNNTPPISDLSCYLEDCVLQC
jgi:hypothetical protein